MDASTEESPPGEENAELISQVSGINGATHLPRWMGVQLRVLKPGVTEGVLPSRPEILNYRGVFHGGAVSTLADVTMISAVKSQAPTNSLPVTVSLQVNFLHPGREALRSEGRVVRIGGGLGFATVRIRDESGSDVASGSGVFRLLVR